MWRRPHRASAGSSEPLLVYPDEHGYVILDGVQRYRALAELGIELIPCIIGKAREAFTPNRMVNRLSPIQENRMIEKSLQELDEQSIASALGVSGIGHRLKRTLLKRLHPHAAAAFDQDKITRGCARELTHVKPQRQKEVIAAMETYNDFSIAFARSLIIKTPPALRETRRRKNDPWDKAARHKNNLLRQLADAEQKHDFYSGLYKQYTIDLLRLAIFVRSLLTNPRVREYLDRRHASIVTRFEAIIAEARG